MSAVLSAERVALNFVQHLSGIATATNAFVRKIGTAKTRICCTRKTTPGLRSLEKYAVRCGGGFNHRFGLDDAILIKDNHIAVAGGIRPVARRYGRMAHAAIARSARTGDSPASPDVRTGVPGTRSLRRRATTV